MIRIYHNPRCSKSRQALEILRQEGKNPEIIEYLKTPLTAATLRDLLKKLNLPARDIVRTKEAGELDIDLTALEDDTLIAEIVKNPVLIERPIVVTDKGALICRPPEKLYDIL